MRWGWGGNGVDYHLHCISDRLAMRGLCTSSQQWVSQQALCH